jgi:ABC-type multidrug transport system ATPase subunit
MALAISFYHVTRRFGAITAVDDLTFHVHPEEIFGLLGSDGAGKTTVINLITGLLPPNSGDIEVLAFDPQTDFKHVRQHIGLIAQDTNVYGALNAIDNLWHQAVLSYADPQPIQERIEEVLCLLGLWEYRNDSVSAYSTGMKRRLALARALLHDPEIICFDEPTHGLDESEQHSLWNHILSLRDQGKTFVIATNDPAEAAALCDRLVIIKHGQAIATGSPDSLKIWLGREMVMPLRTDDIVAEPKLLVAELG